MQIRMARPNLALLLSIVLSVINLSHCSDAASSSLPWLLPSKERHTLPWVELHNNLPELLELQAYPDKWVTVFVYSKPVTRWALNALYSYVVYGRGSKYIVATLDNESITSCM